MSKKVKKKKLKIYVEDKMKFLYTNDESVNIIKADEYFVHLHSLLYPEIPQDRYMISNYGNIYDLKDKKLKHLIHKDPTKNPSPYYRVYIKNKDYLVHRLMLETFKPLKYLYDMKNMVCDHIDCNKLNNHIDNLRWATVKENTNYALKNNLLKPAHGENHVCATITRLQAIEICELIQAHTMTLKVISEQIGCSVSIVRDISSGKSWKDISCNYDFSSNKQTLPKCFTFDDIENMCKYFQENKKDDNISVRKHCLHALEYIKYPTDIISESVLNGVRSIYNKKRYIEIANKYQW